MSGLQIAAPDARLQAIFLVVGELGDLIQVVVVEGLHADDRPEDVLPDDRGRLAAERERYTLQVAGRLLYDELVNLR